MLPTPAEVRPGAQPLLHNMRLEAELVRIARAFREAGIEFVVLKGVPLTRRLHGRLDARTMVDNDILVRRRDVLRAAHSLHELGYRPREFHTVEGDLRSTFQSALSCPTPGGGNVWVELHWSAFLPQMFPVSEELEWSRLEPFELRGEQLAVFDPTMTLVHLAAHFAQHECTHPRILEDIAEAWNRWHARIDRTDLVQLSVLTGVGPTLAYTLAAAATLGWLSAEPPALPSRRAALLAKILPARRLTKTEASQYARIIFTALLLRPSCAARWLFGHVVPPLETLAALHETRLSPWLYLRYASRPFRGLRRIVRGEHRKPTR
ncbi:MAG TPA: nucleotidyltransferase family protein [Polyangiaceae bacterium]|nr:nucleotidyltransferase family protein [Polyangiaceae bacterium]